jgi:adenosylhomocysteine nucleosidase
VEAGFTALVVAYGPEERALLETIEARPDAAITRTVAFRGVTYHLGEFRGERVLVFATGMSIANAAMTLQMALDYFPVRRVIYMGIAGGVNEAWTPGDVVVPARWYYHDESVYLNPDPARPGAFILPDYYENSLAQSRARRLEDEHAPTYERGFGFLHADEVLAVREGMARPERRAYFAATPGLMAAAERAVGRLRATGLEVVPGRATKLSVGGNGVTGSVFVDNREYREWLRATFQAEVTEMESAAIGQVAWVNGVDWLVIRAVSDLAGGQEGKNEENVYDYPVALGAAAVLFGVLEEVTAAAGARKDERLWRRRRRFWPIKHTKGH